MPNLPKPRLRRASRTRIDGHAAQSAAEPNVQVVEHGGLRWINIERPGALEQGWIEDRFEFPPLDCEEVRPPHQQPTIDEEDESLFIALHFPVFDTAIGRLNTGALDVFV